ncbi:carboxy-cis,cis-muconate cyclase [Limosilactobacillus frumenti DSM 13145]|uniref:Carboxy-cis,cis-muconate cyclase n=1 Tax=Limosilactobacillus frumenti DSM 13145 TaxID=1423746 RepID=A0A0R1PC37_9LACO|nr:lactonase family protein [Limosilactobacillus frumenti]KRL25848.1 carboxy-cis,cis-muconate cyclase [Limosilactobacillus frumenti DSM 13145]MBA2914041.1 lactonase family protein [Limosilactobacillus frumenti]QFG72384.1 lactonase family protein [Limosilactobacillus frumenti]
MTEQFLIGTYTKKDSKGMYKVTLDDDAGKITKVELAIPSQKPAYLQVGSDKTVYAVKQIDDQGGVASYSLKDDNAKMLSKVLAAGAPPAYVGLDEERHLLYSANYHTAKVDVFRINPDHTLTQTDSVLHQGATGPQPEQDSPHVHFADLTPDKRLVVCDLGMDLVVVYNVSDDGKLTAVSRYKSEDGFGSRHIAFHPNGKYAYLLGELSSKLEVLKYNANDGTFSHVQTIKTIPADWTSHNGAAAIRLSSDGKFIYTSNRGENTIAVFEIQPDFTVKHIQSISTEGDFPRDFNLSADESYLLASNQNSDNLTLYKRDAETGKLTMLQKDVHCPEPVCVQRF